jgi:intracellular sulfur oxidation DsrE/DsrF family protein
MKSIPPFLFFLSIFHASGAFAGAEAFHEGPLIEGYGKIAEVPGASAVPKDATFRVAWDVAEAAEPGALNRRFDTVARFMNMHVAAGVPAERLQLALVVHGGAHRDLLRDAAYGGENPNGALIAQLVEHGVRVTLCGQTAAYYDVTASDLLPGVSLSLSAMTAHALLQQEGYSLNPF